jgi:hypothetical protein
MSYYRDGSYYYQNPDGSTYYNDGQGRARYTPAPSPYEPPATASDRSACSGEGEYASQEYYTDTNHGTAEPEQTYEQNEGKSNAQDYYTHRRQTDTGASKHNEYNRTGYTNYHRGSDDRDQAGEYTVDSGVPERAESTASYPEYDDARYGFYSWK